MIIGTLHQFIQDAQILGIPSDHMHIRPCPLTRYDKWVIYGSRCIIMWHGRDLRLLTAYLEIGSNTRVSEPIRP